MATIFMPVHDIPLSAPPEPFQESRRGTETLNCELDEWNAGYGDEEAVAFPPDRDMESLDAHGCENEVSPGLERPTLPLPRPESKE